MNELTNYQFQNLDIFVVFVGSKTNHSLTLGDLQLFGNLHFLQSESIEIDGNHTGFKESSILGLLPED